MDKITVFIGICVYMTLAYITNGKKEFKYGTQMTIFNNDPVSLDAKSGTDYKED